MFQPRFTGAHEAHRARRHEPPKVRFGDGALTKRRSASGQRRIVWLASYPRSGNAWLNMLLANFLSASTEPVGINEAGRLLPVVEPHRRSILDGLIGISSSDCTEAEVESLRPAACRAFAEQREPKNALLFCNTHEAYGDSPLGEPLFPNEVTVGAVYIVRNPLDVVVSCAYYYGREGFAEVIADLNSRKTCMGGHAYPMIRQRLLSWSGHVGSWSGAPFPVLQVRYEDLLADCIGWLGRVARFLRLDGASDRGRLERAAANSSFARLRENEACEGFTRLNPRSRTYYFRSGVAGGWRRHLSAAQAREVQSAHGPTMARFGY